MNYLFVYRNSSSELGIMFIIEKLGISDGDVES